MKNIICIVAKTGRGKDTLAKQIKTNLGIPQVVSYTTRAIRKDDVDGVSHHFISPEKMKELLQNEDIIAYASKPSGVEYCATYVDLGDETVYIIDPEGIDYLQSHFGDKVNLFVVELWADDAVVDERIKNRGDNWDTYKQRLANEAEEFGNFHEQRRYNISIDATQSPEKVFTEFATEYAMWKDQLEYSASVQNIADRLWTNNSVHTELENDERSF